MFNKIAERLPFMYSSIKPTLSRFALFAQNSYSSKKPELIDPKQMVSFEDSPSETTYELMFATKAGLPIPLMPISHSAIALKNCASGAVSVYGRQSPWDFSQWLKHGITLHTQKDDEKKYLTEGYPFIGHQTGVAFNKEEINYFLNSADELINRKQTCNMFSSNCYSYSTTAFSFAIDALLKRSSFNAQNINQVIDVIEEHPLHDHFAIGVRNNAVVMNTLCSVLSAVQTKVTSLDCPSPANKQLGNRVALLLDKLGREHEVENVLSQRSMGF